MRFNGFGSPRGTSLTRAATTGRGWNNYDNVCDSFPSRLRIWWAGRSANSPALRKFFG
jgi:hypothetical protein